MMTHILPRLLEFMSPSSHWTPLLASRSLQILTTLTALITDTREGSNDIVRHFESVLAVFTGCIHRPVREDEEWLVKVNFFGW